jgi:hypothetical protein
MLTLPAYLLTSLTTSLSFFHYLYFIYFEASCTQILDFLIFQPKNKGACKTQVNTVIHFLQHNTLSFDVAMATYIMLSNQATDGLQHE